MNVDATEQALHAHQPPGELDEPLLDLTHREFAVRLVPVRHAIAHLQQCQSRHLEVGEPEQPGTRTAF